MHKDNLLNTKLTDWNGTVFELTEPLGKWGYKLLRNGKQDAKDNMAMDIFHGQNGKTYSADNNGTIKEWNTNRWDVVIKDSKVKADEFLVHSGRPPLFNTVPSAKPLVVSTGPKPTITQSLLNPRTVHTPITQAEIEMKMADLLPPESALAKPLGSGVTLLTELIKDPAAQPTSTSPLTDTPQALTASGFSFSNPFIIGGMILAVILMFFVAKKYKG